MPCSTLNPAAYVLQVVAEGHVLWVLQDIFTHEKRLRRLAVHTKRGALVGPVHFANPRARLGLGNTGFPSGGNIASLKCLEHLYAPGFNALDAGDCAALAAHPSRFTFLHLPPVSRVPLHTQISKFCLLPSCSLVELLWSALTHTGAAPGRCAQCSTMQDSSVGLARALHTQARSLRDLTLAADLSAETLAVLQVCCCNAVCFADLNSFHTLTWCCFGS